MAFLGRERWDPPAGSIFRALEAEATTGGYADILMLSDEPRELADFVERTEPKPKPDAGH
jgi:hypothetical protein